MRLHRTRVARKLQGTHASDAHRDRIAQNPTQARITSIPEEVIFHGEEEGREEEGHEEEGRQEEEVTGIWTWHVLRGALAQCRPPLLYVSRRREARGGPRQRASLRRPPVLRPR